MQSVFQDDENSIAVTVMPSVHLCL